MAEQATCGFTRRSFIKGAATLTAAGALMGCNAQAEAFADAETEAAAAVPETQIYAGACRSQCGQGCYLNVHVRDGQVVRTTAGNFDDGPEFNRICGKGLTHPARVYSAERLQYPMRRVGERGEGKFERITWDEAITEVTDKFKGYIEEFGPTSVAFFMGSGNTGNLGGGAPEGSLMKRLTAVLGASRVLPDRDIATPMSWAYMFGQGPYANRMADLPNADHLVIWGGDIAVSDKQRAHFMLEAQASGTELVVVDISCRTMCAKADWFVPVHPGTDGALALGTIREIFEQGWEATDFLRDRTEAPLLVKEDGMFLRMSDLGVEPTETTVNAKGEEVPVDPCVVWDEEAGAAVPLAEAIKPALGGVEPINGIAVRTELDMVREAAEPWTLEHTSEVTGLSVEDIQHFAHMYTQEGNVATDMKFGLNHYNNGMYSSKCVNTLLLVSGQMGRPGAGLYTGEPNFSEGNTDACINLPSATGEAPQGIGAILNWTDFCNNIIPTGKKMGEDFPVKAFYVSCSNLVSNQTDQNKTIECFKNIEFVVVQEMTMNDTSLYADILLPACHWFETTDLRVRYYSNPYLLWNEKAIEPLYESKPDAEIYRMIADAMGYGDFFQFTDDEYLNTLLTTPYGIENNITIDKIREKNYLRTKITPDVVFENGFGTASGRAMFYREDPKPDYMMGQELDINKEKLSAYWEPAREADLSNEIREKFPFTICCEHMRTRTHTQWYDVDYLKEYERQPVCRINPEDAAEYGIEEGDTVRLYNDRGSVTLLATINPGEPRTVLHCPRSFLNREHIDGDLARTTSNEYNQACRNQAYFDCAVAIEKL